MDVPRLELNSELIDWLTEAVVLPADGNLRAERICAIVEAIVDAVGWRSDDPGGPAELLSASRILVAAQEHQLLMRTGPMAVAPLGRGPRS